MRINRRKEEKAKQLKRGDKRRRRGFYYLRKYLKFLRSECLWLAEGVPAVMAMGGSTTHIQLTTCVCVSVISPPTHCPPSVLTSLHLFISGLAHIYFTELCFHHLVVPAAIILHPQGRGEPASGPSFSVLYHLFCPSQENIVIVPGAGVRRFKLCFCFKWWTFPKLNQLVHKTDGPGLPISLFTHDYGPDNRLQTNKSGL